MKSWIAFFCVISLAFAEQSPVFLWGVNSASKPSLGAINESEFAELIAAPLKNDKTLVVFLERALTNNDFSCVNITTSKSCFARLQGVAEKNFFASVQNPVGALRSISGINYEFNSVDASGKLKNTLEIGKGKIVFVTFDDDHNVDRVANLESHDSTIASVSSNLGKNVFFIYTTAPLTSVKTALKRERRSTAATSNGFVFRNGGKLLLFFTSLAVENSNDKSSTPLEVQSMQISSTNSTAMSVTLTSTHPLTFDITLSGGYFFMTNVKWNNIQFRSTDVYSPTDFSYFCGNLTLYGIGTADETSTYTLKWNSFQFQAPFASTENDKFVFGDPWHCVGFFTGGILSGLLIVALLLTITFIGVCWMMDINTMDRFDDPKGKTITINASE